jgi:hypothetical protein
VKATIPYLYRVQPRPKAGRTRWALSVVPPRGAPSVLARYRSRAQAIGAARMLAFGGGMVEVRP